MTTAKPKSASQDCSTLPTDAFKRYLDVMLEGHDKFTAAVKDARSRTARVNDEILESLAVSQRHALELGKKFAEHPTDVTGNMKAAVEAANSAQTRAVEFARFLFREQADFSKEFRQSLSTAYDASKELGQGFKGFQGFNAFAMPWLKPAAQ